MAGKVPRPVPTFSIKAIAAPTQPWMVTMMRPITCMGGQYYQAQLQCPKYCSQITALLRRHPTPRGNTPYFGRSFYTCMC